MLIQSLIDIEENLQGMAIWLFLLAICIDLLIFYLLDKPIKHKIFFNISSILIKLMYILCGTIDMFFFWFATIFLYFYIWIVWLKFRTSLVFDFIQVSNFFFLFFFFNLSLLFTINCHILVPIIIDVGIGLFLFPQLECYFSRKKKALKYRELAIEKFKKKHYYYAKELLSKGFSFADDMTPIKATYYDTALKKHMKKELKNLIEFLDKKDLSKADTVFFKPKFTKSDIIRHLKFSALIFPTIFLVLLNLS